MPRSEKVTFEGSLDSTLAGRLELPDASPIGYALFAHCFACSQQAFAASRISKGLARRGVAVLRFDFTGLGSSEGDFANTNFSSNVDDLLHAASFLRERHGPPALLIGHSLGGAAVLAAAPRIPDANVVATIGAPFDVAHVTSLFGDRLGDLESQGEIEVDIGGQRFPIRRQFLTDVSQHNLAEAIRALKRPLVVFHSPVDEIVGIDHARRIYETARHPKSFVSLDRADHLLSRPDDAAFVTDTLVAVAARYVGAAPDHRPSEPLARGTVVVSEAGDAKYAQVVRAGRHVLRADEPPEVGTDSGPNPYELLLASLGACTSMTLRMYADRKGWPLREVSVELNHSRIHADDCADCEKRSGKLDRIDRVIELDGELTDDQRARLLEIAERCPVHRTLLEEKQIVTRLCERR